MSFTKILIIDDDIELSQMLVEYLSRFSFHLITAKDGQEGLKEFQKNKVELIILDIMLPGKNGFEVCKEFRAASEVPILFLSARGEVSDRIVGLEFGADDYLSKPFEPRELVARIQTILRRTQINEKKKNNSIITIGQLSVNPTTRTVTLKDESILLTTFEFELLHLLISHRGTIISRDKISERLKNSDWDGIDRGIDIGVSRLRQKLNEDPKNPKYLKTIWGSGYLFLDSN